MPTEIKLPKVSVGIPTYNRVAILKQAINTVLDQDYANIELIISDNASTDQTQEICEKLSCKDGRVKYVRQEYNRGPAANLEEVLHRSGGEFFMWLSDDDWIDSSYISECVKALLKEDDLSLVSGKVKYYSQDNSVYEGKRFNLLQDSGLNRLLGYYLKVRDNGVFYGVMRKRDLRNIVMVNTMGMDALIIATIAFLGKVKTLDSVSVHRRLGGTSDNWKKIASTQSLPKFEGTFPVLSIAISAFKDISWRVPVFSRLGRMGRHIVAGCVFFMIIFTKSVPLFLIESSKNILKLFFGETRAKNIRSFLKKSMAGKAEKNEASC